MNVRKFEAVILQMMECLVAKYSTQDVQLAEAPMTQAQMSEPLFTRRTRCQAMN
jgi:hypothetical protein